MSMSKRRFRAVVLAAVGVAALLLFLRRGTSAREGGDRPGAARAMALQAAAAPVRTGSAPVQASAAAAPTRRPALRGAYRRGEGGAVEVEVEHGLPRLPTGPYPASILRAGEWGADAKVTLRVVDPGGRAVTGAHVSGCFYNNGREGRDVEGDTGAQGEFVLSGRCSGDLNFRVNKAGWYETALRYWCFKPGFDCVKDGRWQPWNPTVPVTLKEQRKPIPMYARRIELDLPKGKKVGFDCQAGSFVSPYGRGVSSDFAFHYESVCDASHSYQTNQMDVVANDGGGLLIVNMDEFCQLQSAYEAPDQGYDMNIHFDYARTDSKIIRNNRLPSGTYIVFAASRSIPAVSNETSICYGKIYGFEYGESFTNTGYVRFSYYFNPTPNDRNLEFDGKTNLFRPSWHDYDWPREP